MYCHSLSSCSPINATQTLSCYVCMEILLQYCTQTLHILLPQCNQISACKLFGASARLYFRGTATLLIKALRHVQALSPSASWYCLLKPKEPNNNKHLCCYRLSLSDQLLGRYFQSIQAPLKRKKSRAHPPTPRSPTPSIPFPNYSPTMLCSFLLILAVLSAVADF